MRKKLNCPNCGAPITETKCLYCGTVFYDFTAMDNEKPTYIRMNWYGKQICIKALMRSAEIKIEPDAFPEIDILFMALPDDDGIMLMQKEMRGDNK